MKLTDDPCPTRISIAQCRKVLKNESLTDEQILLIRDFLYLVAEVDYKYHEQREKHQTLIIPLNISTYAEKGSNSIRPRKYRRAS